MRGIEVGKAWLKERKKLDENFPSEALPDFWVAYESYLQEMLSTPHANDVLMKNHLVIKGHNFQDILEDVQD